MSYPPAYAFMNDVIKLWHDSALNPKFKTERKKLSEKYFTITMKIFYEDLTVSRRELKKN